MCIRISIVSEKEELQEKFNDYQSPFNFEPIYNGSPLHKYPVYTEEGIKILQWGVKKEKLKIHQEKEGVANQKRGVLALTGFFLWKTEKTPAPIGFGDHKETIKVVPHYLKRKDDDLLYLPVIINGEDNTFFIIVETANLLINSFQEKSPILLSSIEKWMKEGELINEEINTTHMEIYEVSKKVNQVNYNEPEVIFKKQE